MTLALALENSQNQFNASNAPSIFSLDLAAQQAAINNPDASYTNQAGVWLTFGREWKPNHAT
jgi:hypothetical protein